MNAAPADAWLPLARRMLEDFGVSDVSDDELVPLIHACKGSVRNIADSVLTIAVRKGVPANIIY
jgi:hypothetical protein